MLSQFISMPFGGQSGPWWCGNPTSQNARTALQTTRCSKLCTHNPNILLCDLKNDAPCILCPETAALHPSCTLSAAQRLAKLCKRGLAPKNQQKLPSERRTFLARQALRTTTPFILPKRQLQRPTAVSRKVNGLSILHASAVQLHSKPLAAVNCRL